MKSELIYSYVKALEKLPDYKYLQSVIRYNASPVIEGKKPAAIVTLSSSGRNLKSLWLSYCDNLWEDRDLRWSELRRTDNLIIIMIYRTSLIHKLTSDFEVKSFFKRYGYTEISNIEKLINKIKDKYIKECPHEVGVLLGIPVKDVEAFVKGEGEPIIKTGYWIVYNDVEDALRTFALYDSIRERVIYDIINEVRV